MPLSLSKNDNQWSLNSHFNSYDPLIDDKIVSISSRPSKELSEKILGVKMNIYFWYIITYEFIYFLSFRDCNIPCYFILIVSNILINFAW